MPPQPLNIVHIFYFSDTSVYAHLLLTKEIICFILENDHAQWVLHSSLDWYLNPNIKQTKQQKRVKRRVYLILMMYL